MLPPRPGPLVLLVILASLALGAGCAPADGDRPGRDGDGDADDGSDDGDGDAPGGAGGASGGPELCQGVECGHHEGCVVEDDAPSCACLPGFTGEGCDEDVDECLDASTCGDGATCVNTIGGHACLCRDDFVRTAGGCEAIDECSADATRCASEADCTDTGGAPPDCSCPSGYFGDGTFCSTSDPCAGVDCHGGTCVPTPAGALCDCPLGSSGLLCQDTSSCSDIQFASSTLEDHVRARSGVAEGPLDAAELALTSLAITSTQHELVDDLAGLECLVSLTALSIHGQSLTSLGPVAGLGRLESLTLTCTPVAELGPLAAALRLRSLSLGGGACASAGQITSLAPLAGLTHLNSLDVSLQPITSLAPLAELPGLQLLVAEGITTVDFSALGQLTRLRELSLSGSTGFDWDDVLALPYLRRLAVSGTGLTTLEGLAAQRSLREVVAAENELEELGGRWAEGLYSLDVSQNRIATVAGLALPPGTTWLNLWGNRLSDADELLDANLPAGLELWLFDNDFDCERALPVFDQLEARGLAVLHDCPLL